MDGSRTRNRQVCSLMLFPVELPQPMSSGFRTHSRNTPYRPLSRGRRAAGLGDTVALLVDGWPPSGGARDAGGSRTRLKPLCRRLPCRLAPASSCLSALARNRTWSTSFAGSRAKSGTLRGQAVPRRGVEPRLTVPKTAVLPSHSQGTWAANAIDRTKPESPPQPTKISRPGVEPGPRPSESRMQFRYTIRTK